MFENWGQNFWTKVVLETNQSILYYGSTGLVWRWLGKCIIFLTFLVLYHGTLCYWIEWFRSKRYNNLQIFINHPLVSEKIFNYLYVYNRWKSKGSVQSLNLSPTKFLYDLKKQRTKFEIILSYLILFQPPQQNIKIETSWRRNYLWD